MRARAALGLLSPGLLFDNRHDVRDAAGSSGIQLLAAVANTGPGGLLDFPKSHRAGANGRDYPLSADSPAMAYQR